VVTSPRMSCAPLWEMPLRLGCRSCKAQASTAAPLAPPALPRWGLSSTPRLVRRLRSEPPWAESGWSQPWTDR